MANSVDAINASLYQRLNYDFVRDIAPVARVASMPLVLAVNASFPARSVPEFIAYAKANPSKINLGSSGLGTPVNVAGELFKMKTGINVGQVQYRGSAPALADLLGGQVQAMFPAIAESIEYIRDGRLRALAVTTTARSDVLPDTPILADYVPGVEASFWTGVTAPKNTPVEIIDMLNKEINAGLADPKLKARFADLGATPVPGSPADFREFIAEETEKWGKVVKFAGVRADQEGERVRRVGVLVLAAENDFMQRDATLAFREELRKQGWTEGGNLQLDLRFGAGDSSRIRAYAGELVSLGIVVAGGMMSYGTDIIQVWRQTASYVDRILRGAKPGDLPVQFPTKFELAVNVKTAKALGLTIPESFLLRADEVIE
jgi:tripartite-type tricarboxylate transporter receptor subunit TctC